MFTKEIKIFSKKIFNLDITQTIEKDPSKIKVLIIKNEMYLLCSKIKITYTSTNLNFKIKLIDN